MIIRLSKKLATAGHGFIADVNPGSKKKIKKSEPKTKRSEIIREKVLELFLENPDISCRMAADQLGISYSFLMLIRGELIEAGRMNPKERSLKNRNQSLVGKLEQLYKIFINHSMDDPLAIAYHNAAEMIKKACDNSGNSWKIENNEL